MRALLDSVASRLAASTRLDEDTRADARREARLLVASALGCEPGDVARRIDQPLSPHGRDQVMAVTARRERGEPLAYASGAAAFRTLTLRVDARVLIPRPETEIVVGEALRLCAPLPGGIAVDIGTGSGAIALSLATEGRFDLVMATDISDDALDVARRNAADLMPTTRMEFRSGADLAPLVGVQARVIVSNPPYISYEEASSLPAAVRDWEPATALYAGHRGMARYEVLFSSAASCLEAEGYLVCEVDSRRAGETLLRAQHHGWRHVRLVPDLHGRDRVLVAQPPAHEPR